MDPRLRALVVDDSPSTANIVAAILRQCGVRDVDEAFSGEEALTAISQRRHHLVLSDVQMPGINGLQLLATVRNDAVLNRTCFILMTATRDREIIDTAMLYRADTIIFKPFTKAVLQGKLTVLKALRPSQLGRH